MTPSMGVLVELEVARMHHRALRRANVDTQGPRDGMGHREEINRDGSQLNMRATLNLAELGGAQFKTRPVYPQ